MHFFLKATNPPFAVVLLYVVCAFRIRKTSLMSPFLLNVTSESGGDRGLTELQNCPHKIAINLRVNDGVGLRGGAVRVGLDEVDGMNGWGESGFDTLLSPRVCWRYCHIWYIYIYIYI